MTRFGAAYLVSAGLLLAAVDASAQAPLPPAAPAPTAQAPAPVLIERQDARQTREQLHALLRQHPPEVGEILRRDPTLARADYLAPYPSLVSFLQQHPEVTRNPSFFFGEYVFREEPRRSASQETFRRVFDGFNNMLLLGAALGTFVWLIRSVIDQRRWLRVSRTQAEVHTKLLDRLTNNEDLLAYIQTPSGRRFLESGPLLTDGDAPPAAGSAPLSRIVLSLQAGIVLASLGVGFWLAQTRVPVEEGEGFFIVGMLAMALGIGFAVSAFAAFVVSSRFGLVGRRPAESHD